MRLAIPLLLLAGCFSPHYQNGKPCSASGECPSGFSCIAGVCYAPGAEPHDLGVQSGGDDLSMAPVTPDMVTAAPDMTPVVVSAPPPGYWSSSGGASLQSSTSTNQLNMSLGEIGLTGKLVAPSGASIELGLFSSDAIQ